MNKTDLEECCLARIKLSADRLIKLIALDAPSAVIGNEIGLLVQRASALVGKSVFDFALESLVKFERRRIGFCMESGCDNKLVSETDLREGFCAKHLFSPNENMPSLLKVVRNEE